MGVIFSKLFRKRSNRNSAAASTIDALEGGQANSAQNTTINTPRRNSKNKSNVKYVLVEDRKPSASNPINSDSNHASGAVLGLDAAITKAASDLAPISPIIQTNKKQENPSEINGAATTMMSPHEFIWRRGGNKVILTGTFDDWSQSILMSRDVNNGIFRSTVILDTSKDWKFKFVVDGVWECSDEYASETDSLGNVNNVIRAQHHSKPHSNAIDHLHNLRAVLSSSVPAESRMAK